MEPWVNTDKRMKRALKGRHSCIAQGGIRAKPDMEPWVNTDKRMKRALKGRHSCIAQGEMRAKPDMKPWVNTDKSRLSSVGAALTHASKCPKGTIRSHAIYLSLPRIRNKRYLIIRHLLAYYDIKIG